MKNTIPRRLGPSYKKASLVRASVPGNKQHSSMVSASCFRVSLCPDFAWWWIMSGDVSQEIPSFPRVAFDWSVSSQQRNEKQSLCQARAFRCLLWKWQPGGGFLNLVCAGPRYPVPAGIFLLFVLFGHVTHQHTFRRRTSRKGRLTGALCLPEPPSHRFSRPLVLIDRWPIFFFPLPLQKKSSLTKAETMEKLCLLVRSLSFSAWSR